MPSEWYPTQHRSDPKALWSTVLDARAAALSGPAGPTVMASDPAIFLSRFFFNESFHCCVIDHVHAVGESVMQLAYSYIYESEKRSEYSYEQGTRASRHPRRQEGDGASGCVGIAPNALEFWQEPGRAKEDGAEETRSSGNRRKCCQEGRMEALFIRAGVQV